ncbi:MAG: hypothetical protein AAF311_04260 [Pseudomonadota bacterium]
MIRRMLTFALMAVAFPAFAQEVRLHTGGAGDRVEAASGYAVSLFASRLGDVAALAMDAEGTIYVADRKGGRVMRVTDRARDGAADLMQPLPYRFDTPTGLAVSQDGLFVADRQGLWRVSAAASVPQRIAAFGNSESVGAPHPLAIVGPATVRLGLPHKSGTARLIDIDTRSGAATLVDQSDGIIRGFAAAEAGGPTFVILANGDGVRFGERPSLSRSVETDILALRIDGPVGRAQMALKGGVYDSAATFAGIGAVGDPILTGFGPDSPPSAILADARGLFVSDGAGGRIWRVVRTEADDARPAEAEPGPSLQPETQTARPVLPRGSRIGRASTLTPARPPSEPQPQPQFQPEP